MKSAISRRSLLKALGPFVACLPIANLLRMSIAEAGPAIAPLRLVLVWGNYHAVEQFWHPQTSSGALATSGTDFTLTFQNSILAPLAPYQSKLIVFRGLNRADYVNATAGHMTQPTSFTGAKCSYPSNGQAAPLSAATSIDQYLYGRIGGTGKLPPMLTGLWSTTNDLAFSWLGGNPQPVEGNPTVVYQTYFGNFMAPSQDAGPSPQLQRRNAMINYSQSGLKDLMGRLSGPEAQKLDQHLSSLTAFSAQLNGSIAQTASCTPPAPGSLNNDKGPDDGTIQPGNQNPPNNLNLDASGMITLISQAFACDITRFASLQLCNPDSYNWDGTEAGFFAEIPQMPPSIGSTFNDSSNTWHGYTHGTGDASNPEDLAQAYFEQYQMTQIYNLMKALDAIPDPLSPSQTLLDNTVILFMGQHCVQVQTGYQGQTTNCHGGFDARCFVAGGCGGMFNTGRILEATPRLAAGTTSKPLDQNVGAYAGVPHNGLLTAIVNAFETNQAKYNPSYVPNILSGYGDFSTAQLML
jgi:hypothetical protein